MTAPDVLAEVRAAGVQLHATPEGNLHWRCPGPLPDRLRQLLAAHKADLLALLPAPIAPADLPDDWRDTWGERAAIAEFDGGLSREDAEAQALADVLWQRGLFDAAE